MRVVSLLPAATEIAGALGLAHLLVGVSHECDDPPEVSTLPRVTRCEIHGADLESSAIDSWVRDSLQATGTLYTLDAALLAELRPDVILTQALCDVCAVPYDSVAALARQLSHPPRLVNLEPAVLDDIFEDILRVAEALGYPERGHELAAGLRERVESVRIRAAGAARRPCCFLMEWIDPPFCAGHWNPELVELAGATEVLGRAGEPSRTLRWEEVLEAAPEVIVLACCGYPVERTLRDLPVLSAYPGWADLPAVRSGRVYAVDGNLYFARPGLRVVDSLEILAGILHPELFASTFPERVAVRIDRRGEVSEP